MLLGEAVVAIWNGITDEGRAAFYAWHVTEHIPERIGISGFLRGRRYRATDTKTHPEFFTLYEVETFAVTTSQAYLDRLNNPTPWTKTATEAFRDTSRGACHVIKSVGPGSGGNLATIRFDVASGKEQAAKAALSDLVQSLSRLPQVTGAHIAATDLDASGVKTAESKGRSDIQAPPNWFVLIETCTAERLKEPIEKILRSEFVQTPNVGLYVLEYARLRTDHDRG